MPKRTLYLATQNSGKLQEIKAILTMAELDWNVYLCDRLQKNVNWQETGSTFLENARIKAYAVKSLTKDCVLSDDSGLEVDVLDGAPGIYSSRYSGNESSDQNNINKLLSQLPNIPTHKHAARFVCCLVFINEHQQERHFFGYLTGTIASQPKGSHGFGYDPIFIPTGFNQTLAELPAGTKNMISHRKKALDQWLDYIKHCLT